MDYYKNIISFIEKHEGEKYRAENVNLKKQGQEAYCNAKRLGKAVENRLNGFKFLGSSKWQNSGNIGKYFWLQFKREQYINKPFSISITALKKNGKCVFQVYLEVSYKDSKIFDQVNRSDLSNFNQSIKKLKLPPKDFYFQGMTNDKLYIDIENNIDSINKAIASSSYVKISTMTDVYVNEFDNDTTILEKLYIAANTLIPYYDAIFSNEEHIPQEEIEIISKMDEREIESLLNMEDEFSSYIYKEKLVKTRKINKKIVDILKEQYKGKCQLCGATIGKDFDVEIIEAHHIEYFAKTQNNDSSNIIILCPNCHTLIHKCDPIYDNKNYSFVFPNGKEIKINNPGHLER
ncbi:MAG: HNH endonuclease [Clostridia bacterium]|nr:HNH endonuclease [Clostridia bacterium]MBQ4586424.1 HNH endonuclease [Clostridia bacterium]